MAKKGSVSQAIVWSILGLLFVGLIGFGTRDFGGSVRNVATVGDEEISTRDYARDLQQKLRQLSQEAGQPVNFAQAQLMGFDRAVLASMISDAVLDTEAARLGLSVGDAEVRDNITTLPGFQGPDGAFNRELYALALKQNGLTIPEFETRVRRETARNILQAALVGAVKTPETYTDTFFAWARETRGITWARLTEDDLAEPLPEPSDEDLVAYHEAHASDFTLGETKAITYAWLTPDMMMDKISVDEDALRALYDQRSDEYVQPERRLVERLAFATEADAQAARDKIDAGETTFDDLVEERGLSLDDVDQGEVAARDLGAAAEGVFALEEPGIVGPLPSSLGPALFRVNAILTASETPFEDVRDELQAELAGDRARRAVEDQITQIDDLLAAGATLEELADETDMELGQIDWRQDVTDGPAAYQGFRDAALVAKPGDFPELIELDQGAIAALRVDEVRPPVLQPLSDVKPEVIAGWERGKAEEQLKAQALAAAEEIRNGKEMAGLDLPLRSEWKLTRNAYLDDAPPGFVEGVFQMRPGDVRVFETEGGAALVRLDSIDPPDPDTPEAKAMKANFARQIELNYAQDLLGMYSGRLQAKLQAEQAITVNSQAVNAVHAQLP